MTSQFKTRFSFQEHFFQKQLCHRIARNKLFPKMYNVSMNRWDKEDAFYVEASKQEILWGGPWIMNSTVIAKCK